eukprot:jgi/Botrbrau1/12173/Bobra.0186s0081.1
MPPTSNATVTVVGDTHGQFHDVRHMLCMTGGPTQESLYIFNGDLVDRGAWGIETLLLVAAWKLALPDRVFVLRGNHETATCSKLYGFHAELVAKFGPRGCAAVYKLCKKVFAALPLAALVAGATLVLHGGLFRKRKRKGRRGGPLKLGSLEDLRKSGKGGVDPMGMGSTTVPADVLWSDPIRCPGFSSNTLRGVGTIFGPDITQVSPSPSP